MSVSERNAIWQARLKACTDRVQKPLPLIIEGKLTRMVGLTLEAVGCQSPIGSRCIISAVGGEEIEAEVVGFSGDKTYLMATGQLRGLVPNASVVPSNEVYAASVGDGFLGRVIDGGGRPLDSKGPLVVDAQVPLTGVPINPLARKPIREALDVGVRAINGMLTVGRGQRMGLFA
ncbi:Flagellum-specific ATP synthase FliI, partial [hydrothermal vent metagenome]